MAAPQSDALVLFGITGDLAKKKLLPAVYHLAARDRLPGIVIGVASRELAEGALEERFRDAVGAVEATPDEEVIETVLKRLKYVSGDYREESTFVKLKEALEGAQYPLFYLAIPPSLFDDVVQGLAKQGINKDGRVVVEKPFGRDLESAEELNSILHSAFAESAIYRIDHFLGKESVENLLVFRFANSTARAGLEPQLHQLGADHDGRGVRRRRPGQVLRRGRRAARRRAEPLAAGRGTARAGAAGRRRARKASATRGSSCSGRSAPSTPPRRCEGSTAAMSTKTACEPAPTPRPSWPSASEIDSWRWAGVPWLIRTGKALAATATEAVVEFKAPPRLFFKQPGMPMPDPNHLRFRLGKNDGIMLHLQAKAPGEKMVTRRSTSR